MAVSVTLTRAGATATAIPIGAIAPGHRAVALERAGASAASRGMGVRLVRPPDWAAEATTWEWVSQITTGNRLISQRGTSMTRIVANEGEAATIRGRVTDPNGDLIYQADVLTILVQVFDTTATDRGTPVYQDDLIVSNVMWDALQVDKGWRTDSDGYSYRYEIPENVFKEGGRVYRIESIFTTAAKGATTLVHEVETRPLWSSRSVLGV